MSCVDLCCFLKNLFVFENLRLEKIKPYMEKLIRVLRVYSLKRVLLLSDLHLKL